MTKCVAYVIKMSVWGDTRSGKEKHMPTGRSHATDLRVRKSIRDIKRAVLALIAVEWSVLIINQQLDDPGWVCYLRQFYRMKMSVYVSV